MIREQHDRELVLWPQCSDEFASTGDDVGLLLFHAAAGVQRQHDRDRFDRLLKQLELLDDAVLDHFEVRCRQIQILTRFISGGEFNDRPDRRRFPREVARTRADDILRVVRLDRQRPPRAVCLLILRCIRQQIAVVHVLGQHVVHVRELLIPGREEKPPASLDGELSQEPLALDRNPGDAADAHHIHRCPR